jgi:type I restriction enzyme, R subunit
VFFMRSVKSRTYFEQMKGRGVRVINEADFQAVTPDAAAKSRFVIVDAVGVTETDLADTQPLDRQPTVPLDRLFKQLAFGNRDPDLVSTIAGRIARLDCQLTKDDREELEELAGSSLVDLTHGLLDALDPDRQLEPARVATGAEQPSAGELAVAASRLIDAAVEPLATNPQLRDRLLEVRRSYEQTIDEFSKDQVLEATYSLNAADRARQTVESFREFIEQHKDEITALQILYSRLYQQRPTFKEIKELAHAIGRPPYRWTPEKLWRAYEALDRSKVGGSGGWVPIDVGLARAVRASTERRARPVPEAGPGALPGVAASTGEHRANILRRAAYLARTDPRPTSPHRSASAPTTSTAHRSSNREA